MIQLNDKESYLLNPSRILAVYKTRETTVCTIPSKRWWGGDYFKLDNGTFQIQVVMEGGNPQVLSYAAEELRDADYGIIKRACEIEASQPNETRSAHGEPATNLNK